MLVPAPSPTYTLAPDMTPLSVGQLAALETCLSALTGRLSGVIVMSATTSGSHHLIEMITPAGMLLAMERVWPLAELLHVGEVAATWDALVQ